MFKFFFISTVFIFSSFSAHAQYAPNTPFWDQVDAWNACSEKDCSAEFQETVLFEEGAASLDKNTYQNLIKISQHQANIWGDTILEGDYVSFGDTELDEVTGIFHNGSLFAYLIRYSEKAYYTGGCNYDGEKESLEDCTEGRISETSIVSSDFETYDVYQDNYANFED